MLVKDAIQQLSKLDPEDHIIFAFWTKNLFSFPIADWNDLASMCDECIDWYDISLQVRELARFQWQCRDYDRDSE